MNIFGTCICVAMSRRDALDDKTRVPRRHGTYLYFLRAVKPRLAYASHSYVNVDANNERGRKRLEAVFTRAPTRSRVGR